MSMAVLSDEEAVALSKALGDPTRLSIYTTIASRREVFCGELAACGQISGATISHHLQVLSKAGLIRPRRSGPHIFYRVVPEQLADCRRYLAGIGRPAAVRTGSPEQATAS